MLISVLSLVFAISALFISIIAIGVVIAITRYANGRNRE